METDNDIIVGTVYMTQTINGETEKIEGTLYANQLVMLEDGSVIEVDDETYAEMVDDIMEADEWEPEPDIFAN